MASRYLVSAQVAVASRLAARYIKMQREKYAPRAIALSAQQKAKMAGFFPAELLEETRLLMLGEERAVNPSFYPLMRRLGFGNLPDHTRVAAITFLDTVVSHEPITDGLLFHELVHVEQYRQLGVAGFSRLYVRGFLSGGGYNGIPLEQNAYMLGERYEHDRGRRFSVADDVADWIAAGRF